MGAGCALMRHMRMLPQAGERHPDAKSLAPWGSTTDLRGIHLLR